METIQVQVKETKYKQIKVPSYWKTEENGILIRIWNIEVGRTSQRIQVLFMDTLSYDRNQNTLEFIIEHEPATKAEWDEMLTKLKSKIKAL